MFIKQLGELKRKRKLASFFANENNTSKFSVGYVVDFNEDHFIIAEISPAGQYDGFILDEVSNIFCIKTDGLYEKKMMTLSSHYETNHEMITIEEENLVMKLLGFAKVKNYIVSIELLNSGEYDIKGYIQEVNSECCIINVIGDYGENDGLANSNIADITKIVCHSEDEIILEILYSKNSEYKDA